MAFSYIREYLFPSGCGGCGDILQSRLDAHYGLCGDCRRFFVSALEGEKRCGICGRFLISETETCLSCREGKLSGVEMYGAITGLRTFFPYTGKFRSVLRAYKFEKSTAIGNFFVRCVTPILAGFEPDALCGAAWVPVPPRPGKIKSGGWDQIEHLAKLLERGRWRGTSGSLPAGEPRRLPVPPPLLPPLQTARQLPVRRCLRRLPTRTQKGLNLEERIRNLKGQILCAKKPPETAFLIDDVVTTGATLSACADALLKGGAKRVYGVCLFYT